MLIKLILLEVRVYLRERAAVYWSFMFPIVITAFVVWIYGRNSAYGVSNSFLVTGTLVMSIVSTTLYGFSVLIVDMRARNVFRVLQLLPISTTEYLLAFLLSRVLILTIYGILFLSLGNWIFSTNMRLTWGEWISVTAILSLGSAAFMILGMAANARIASHHIAMIVANIAFFPIVFLSNLFIPSKQLPPWANTIARVLPIHDFAELLRTIVIEHGTLQESTSHIASLLLWTVAGAILVWRFFVWHVDPKDR